MEDELQKAHVISDRMFKAHNERDFDLDWHKERADQLSERWQNIHSQIDSRFAGRVFCCMSCVDKALIRILPQLSISNFCFCRALTSQNRFYLITGFVCRALILFMKISYNNFRLRDLDGISKSLKHYRDSYSSVDQWISELETAQLKAQENKPDDSKALAEILNKQKVREN